MRDFVPRSTSSVGFPPHSTLDVLAAGEPDLFGRNDRGSSYAGGDWATLCEEDVLPRTPDGPPPPPAVQKLRIRYAKRGRLRFTSHRDIARAFERALRRAAVPIAYSAGFTPHPKVSWMGAAPTGMASEAEYVEIGVTRPLEPAELAAALDAALPPGIDVTRGGGVRRGGRGPAVGRAVGRLAVADGADGSVGRRRAAAVGDLPRGRRGAGEQTHQVGSQDR